MERNPGPSNQYYIPAPLTSSTNFFSLFETRLSQLGRTVPHNVGEGGAFLRLYHIDSMAILIIISRHAIYSISNKAPWAIRNLINLRSFRYNLRGQDYVLSLPKAG